MENIPKKDFDQVKVSDKIKEVTPPKFEELTEKEFQACLKDMENPIEQWKTIAVKLKHYLTFKMDAELKEKGLLSDHTRRWIQEYNSILEKIQKGLYGDKSVNLHLHKVSHSDITTNIRNYSQKQKKKKKVEDYR